MRKTALVTGASSGIGYELSKVFAANDHNLILVARSQSQLTKAAERLSAEYGIRVLVIAKDLSRQKAAQELYDDITSQGLLVDVLVNNAGFGINGNFIETSTVEQTQLIQLNIASVTMLCRLFGYPMAERGHGSILNVASTAAFQSGPFLSTYYASKSYVLSLSEALSAEMNVNGVTVTALCPGPTQTKFFEQANMNNSLLKKSPHMMSAADVAMAGYQGLCKGKLIVIPGLINQVLAFSVRLLPRKVSMHVAKLINQVH